MSLLLATSGDIASGEVMPEGVDFDGVNDYLSRGTDLVGNVDSKTFTFSCWVYSSSSASTHYLYTNIDGVSFNGSLWIRTIRVDNRRVLDIRAWNDGGTQILGVGTSSGGDEDFAINTWTHILLSVDMANSSKRSLYINDVLEPITWGIYVDDSIKFTSAKHLFGKYDLYALNDAKFRASNLFLDYTYRDLSIEANRRLFITADGKPADGLASLNPILYLPMTDAATAHQNLGTGGNFVQNGTLATSDRGANQDNCVSSYFDGVDDTMLGSFMRTGTDIILSFNFVHKLNNSIICGEYNDASNRWQILIEGTAINISQVVGGTSKGNNTIYLGKIVVGKNYSVQIMLTYTTRQCWVNGIAQPLYTQTQDYLVPAIAGKFGIGSVGGQYIYDQHDLGEFYADDVYIDLATNNPFWDSETNKPVPVRKAMANLGSNPLICMPIDASNPTKNYGSGGDFVLNGGGLVGARGASEFIARGVYTASTVTNQGLSIASLGGSATTDNLSAVIIFKTAIVTNNQSIFSTYNGVLNKTIAFGVESSTFLKFQLGAISGNIRWSQGYPTIIFLYKNGSTQKIDVYVNGVLLADSFTQVYAQTLDLSGKAFVNQSNLLAGYTAGLNGVSYSTYFTTNYIDFSQEVNRNKFVNQLGYPRDLTPEIEAGRIPTPLVYLPFDDPTNLGKNLGTGGNFSVVGTVTQGADFSL